MTDAALADLSNWRRPPFSRWAFHHVDRIVACAPIANDPGRPLVWPLAPVSLDDFRLSAHGGEPPLDLPRFLERTCNDALVVVHDGRIVFEHGASGMTAESRHILMSASKSVIGLLCGALVERGRLDLHAPLADTLPEIAHTAYARATARDLLDMRVAPGFDRATLTAYVAAAGWDPAPPGHGDEGSSFGLHDFFTALPPSSAPHRGPFAYVSANTDLLGWVIERSTGQTVPALLGELLWAPMGASAPAAITVDRCGAPRCTGGICATARDLARLGQLVAEGGAAGGRQVLPAAWLDDIVDQGDAEAWARGEFAAAFGPRPMHYRSGWYVLREAPAMVFAMGIHGQHLFVDRARGMVVAVLASQPEAIDPVMNGLTHRAVAEIRRLLLAPSPVR